MNTRLIVLSVGGNIGGGARSHLRLEDSAENSKRKISLASGCLGLAVTLTNKNVLELGASMVVAGHSAH